MFVSLRSRKKDRIPVIAGVHFLFVLLLFPRPVFGHSLVGLERSGLRPNSEIAQTPPVERLVGRLPGNGSPPVPRYVRLPRFSRSISNAGTPDARICLTDGMSVAAAARLQASGWFWPFFSPASSVLRDRGPPPN